MIRIAVVDDDWLLSSKIEKIVLAYDQVSTYHFDVEVFHNGADFLRYIDTENVVFDLVFLDIQMPMGNGVEVGKYIRNHKKDNVTQIVYVTAFDGYEQKLFQNRPMDFLKKPFEEDSIVKIIEKYIELYKNIGQKFEFTYQREKLEILFKDIFYFSSTDKKVAVITKEQTYYFYGKLNDIKDKISYTFQIIHKSYIVNRFHVKRYNYTNVIMTNDVSLPISQSYRKDIRKLISSKNDSGKEFFS